MISSLPSNCKRWESYSYGNVAWWCGAAMLRIWERNEAAMVFWWWRCLDLHTSYPIYRYNHVSNVSLTFLLTLICLHLKWWYLMWKNFTNWHTNKIITSHVIRYLVIKVWYVGDLVSSLNWSGNKKLQKIVHHLKITTQN